MSGENVVGQVMKTSGGMMANPIILTMDDDGTGVSLVRSIIEKRGFEFFVTQDTESFLDHLDNQGADLIVLDLSGHGSDAIELFDQARAIDPFATCLFLAADGQIRTVVKAMRRGGFDVFVNPLDVDVFTRRLMHALAWRRTQLARAAESIGIRERLGTLTDREGQVLRLVVQGMLTKQIASKLGISTKTVEVHRSRIVKKTGAESVAQLVRMVLTADLVAWPLDVPLGSTMQRRCYRDTPSLS